jgi:hypothetical protein
MHHEERGRKYRCWSARKALQLTLRHALQLSVSQSRRLHSEADGEAEEGDDDVGGAGEDGDDELSGTVEMLFMCLLELP